MYILEYSHSQDCFHIDPLTKSLESNKNAFLRKYIENTVHVPDFIPIGLFATNDEASNFVAQLRKEITIRTGKQFIGEGIYHDRNIDL